MDNQQPADPLNLFVDLLADHVAQKLQQKATPKNAVSERLLTPSELAERLQVPLSWVCETSRQGRIPTVKIGRYSRFNLAAVLDHLNRAEKVNG